MSEDALLYFGEKPNPPNFDNYDFTNFELENISANASNNILLLTSDIEPLAFPGKSEFDTWFDSIGLGEGCSLNSISEDPVATFTRCDTFPCDKFIFALKYLAYSFTITKANYDKAVALFSNPDDTTKARLQRDLNVSAVVLPPYPSVNCLMKDDQQICDNIGLIPEQCTPLLDVSPTGYVVPIKQCAYQLRATRSDYESAVNYMNSQNISDFPPYPQKDCSKMNDKNYFCDDPLPFLTSCRLFEDRPPEFYRQKIYDCAINKLITANKYNQTANYMRSLGVKMANYPTVDCTNSTRDYFCDNSLGVMIGCSPFNNKGPNVYRANILGCLDKNLITKDDYLDASYYLESQGTILPSFPEVDCNNPNSICINPANTVSTCGPIKGKRPNQYVDALKTCAYSQDVTPDAYNKAKPVFARAGISLPPYPAIDCKTSITDPSQFCAQPIPIIDQCGPFSGKEPQDFVNNIMYCTTGSDMTEMSYNKIQDYMQTYGVNLPNFSKVDCSNSDDLAYVCANAISFFDNCSQSGNGLPDLLQKCITTTDSTGKPYMTKDTYNTVRNILRKKGQTVPTYSSKPKTNCAIINQAFIPDTDTNQSYYTKDEDIVKQQNAQQEVCNNPLDFIEACPNIKFNVAKKVFSSCNFSEADTSTKVLSSLPSILASNVSFSTMQVNQLCKVGDDEGCRAKIQTLGNQYRQKLIDTLTILVENVRASNFSDATKQSFFNTIGSDLTNPTSWPIISAVDRLIASRISQNDGDSNAARQDFGSTRNTIKTSYQNLFQNSDPDFDANRIKYQKLQEALLQKYNIQLDDFGVGNCYAPNFNDTNTFCKDPVTATNCELLMGQLRSANGTALKSQVDDTKCIGSNGLFTDCANKANIIYTQDGTLTLNGSCLRSDGGFGNCDNSNSQKWKFLRSYQVQNIGTGKCLAVSPNAEGDINAGARPYVEDCNDSLSRQRWYGLGANVAATSGFDESTAGTIAYRKDKTNACISNGVINADQYDLLKTYFTNRNQTLINFTPTTVDKCSEDSYAANNTFDCLVSNYVNQNNNLTDDQIARYKSLTSSGETKLKIQSGLAKFYSTYSTPSFESDYKAFCDSVNNSDNFCSLPKEYIDVCTKSSPELFYVSGQFSQSQAASACISKGTTLATATDVSNAYNLGAQWSETGHTTSYPMKLQPPTTSNAWKSLDNNLSVDVRTLKPFNAVSFDGQLPTVQYKANNIYDPFKIVTLEWLISLGKAVMYEGQYSFKSGGRYGNWALFFFDSTDPYLPVGDLYLRPGTEYYNKAQIPVLLVKNDPSYSSVITREKWNWLGDKYKCRSPGYWWMFFYRVPDPNNYNNKYAVLGNIAVPDEGNRYWQSSVNRWSNRTFAAVNKQYLILDDNQEDTNRKWDLGDDGGSRCYHDFHMMYSTPFFNWRMNSSAIGWNGGPWLFYNIKPIEPGNPIFGAMCYGIKPDIKDAKSTDIIGWNSSAWNSPKSVDIISTQKKLYECTTKEAITTDTYSGLQKQYNSPFKPSRINCDSFDYDYCNNPSSYFTDCFMQDPVKWQTLHNSCADQFATSQTAFDDTVAKLNTKLWNKYKANWIPSRGVQINLDKKISLEEAQSLAENAKSTWFSWNQNTKQFYRGNISDINPSKDGTSATGYVTYIYKYPNILSFSSYEQLRGQDTSNVNDMICSALSISPQSTFTNQTIISALGCSDQKTNYSDVCNVLHTTFNVKNKPMYELQTTNLTEPAIKSPAKNYQQVKTISILCTLNTSNKAYKRGVLIGNHPASVSRLGEDCCNINILPDLSIQIVYNKGALDLTLPIKLTPGVLSHLVFVFTLGSVSSYLNGQLANTTAFDFLGWKKWNDVNIGFDNSAVPTYFNGTIQNVFVSSKVYISEEIPSLYRQLTNIYPQAWEALGCNQYKISPIGCMNIDSNLNVATQLKFSPVSTNTVISVLGPGYIPLNCSLKQIISSNASTLSNQSVSQVLAGAQSIFGVSNGKIIVLSESNLIIDSNAVDAISICADGSLFAQDSMSKQINQYISGNWLTVEANSVTTFGALADSTLVMVQNGQLITKNKAINLTISTPNNLTVVKIRTNGLDNSCLIQTAKQEWYLTTDCKTNVPVWTLLGVFDDVAYFDTICVASSAKGVVVRQFCDSLNSAWIAVNGLSGLVKSLSLSDKYLAVATDAGVLVKDVSVLFTESNTTTILFGESVNISRISVQNGLSTTTCFGYGSDLTTVLFKYTMPLDKTSMIIQGSALDVKLGKVGSVNECYNLAAKAGYNAFGLTNGVCWGTNTTNYLLNGQVSDSNCNASCDSPKNWECLAGIPTPVQFDNKGDLVCASRDGVNCIDTPTPAQCSSTIASLTTVWPLAVTNDAWKTLARQLRQTDPASEATTNLVVLSKLDCKGTWTNGSDSFTVGPRIYNSADSSLGGVTYTTTTVGDAILLTIGQKLALAYAPYGVASTLQFVTKQGRRYTPTSDLVYTKLVNGTNVSCQGSWSTTTGLTLTVDQRVKNTSQTSAGILTYNSTLFPISITLNGVTGIVETKNGNAVKIIFPNVVYTRSQPQSGSCGGLTTVKVFSALKDLELPSKFSTYTLSDFLLLNIPGCVGAFDASTFASTIWRDGSSGKNNAQVQGLLKIVDTSPQNIFDSIAWSGSSVKKCTIIDTDGKVVFTATNPASPINLTAPGGRLVKTIRFSQPRVYNYSINMWDFTGLTVMEIAVNTLNGPVTPVGGRLSSQAVGGNNIGNMWNNVTRLGDYVYTDNKDEMNWIEVDLGTPQPVTSVTVYNVSLMAYKNMNLTVSLLDAEANTLYTVTNFTSDPSFTVTPTYNLIRCQKVVLDTQGMTQPFDLSFSLKNKNVFNTICQPKQQQIIIPSRVSYKALVGAENSSITFGSLSSNYTFVSVARYGVGSKQTIFTSSDNKTVIGFKDGQVGVAVHNNTNITPTTNTLFKPRDWILSIDSPQGYSANGRDLTIATVSPYTVGNVGVNIGPTKGSFEIAFVAVFNRICSTEEKQQIANYCANRFGLDMSPITSPKDVCSYIADNDLITQSCFDASWKQVGKTSDITFDPTKTKAQVQAEVAKWSYLTSICNVDASQPVTEACAAKMWKSLGCSNQPQSVGLWDRVKNQSVTQSWNTILSLSEQQGICK